MGFPHGASSKEPACQCRRHKRHGFDSWVGKIPWRRARQPTPVFLPGESHGQRSLAGSTHWVSKSQTWLKWLSKYSTHTVYIVIESCYFMSSFFQKFKNIYTTSLFLWQFGSNVLKWGQDQVILRKKGGSMSRFSCTNTGIQSRKSQESGSQRHFYCLHYSLYFKAVLQQTSVCQKYIQLLVREI